jgi:hypothetical protein
LKTQILMKNSQNVNKRTTVLWPEIFLGYHKCSKKLYVFGSNQLLTNILKEYVTKKIVFQLQWFHNLWKILRGLCTRVWNVPDACCPSKPWSHDSHQTWTLQTQWINFDLDKSIINLQLDDINWIITLTLITLNSTYCT